MDNENLGGEKAILEERSIDVFNYGNMERDFTFVDDIIAVSYTHLTLPTTPYV